MSESTLTSRIKAARRCVGDDGQRQRVIATVHGRGYRMVAPVHRGPEAGPPVVNSVGHLGVDTLVERDDALAQLTTALAAAESGAGRVVCITGEASIGKTALVHWMATALGDQATVLVGACDDLTTPRPMAPLHDIAAGLTAAGSDEIRLVGPVTIARAELAWLAGTGDDLITVAEPVLSASGSPGSAVNRGELGRYLQRAGYRVPQLRDVPEPRRSGLAGDWRGAAAGWELRGEPYEQALELISGGRPTAVETGAAILRNLGAVGAYHLGQGATHSG